MKVYSVYSLYSFPESFPPRGYKLNFTEKCLNYTHYTRNKPFVVNRLSTCATKLNQENLC